MRYLIGLAIVAVLGVFFAINCGEGDDGIPKTNDEFNEMLDGLGFTTDIGPPLDPYGNPLPTSYHPLGSKFAAFNPTSELYVAGFLYDEELGAGPTPEHIFDDNSGSYAPLPFSSRPQTDWTDAEFKNGSVMPVGMWRYIRVSDSEDLVLLNRIRQAIPAVKMTMVSNMVS